MPANPTKLAGTDHYLWSLGLLVANFAVVEGLVQRALWHFAGVSAPTAPAVFSGTKTEGAMSFIRRIAEAQKWNRKRIDEIEYVFSQLGMINKLRNDLLHYGATIELDEPDFDNPEKWLVSNEKFVHIPERIRRMHVTPALLKDATEDLYKISVHLRLMVWSEDDLADDLKLRSYHGVLRRSWRYKPPSPTPTNRTTRKNHPKRQRPQRPSGA